jgi:2,3-bisphosphoglycerate-independent phosphoglycerate mutase
MTYFINGGYADPVNGEDRLRIPSLRIKSYADDPRMSVYKITKKVLSFVKNGKYEFIAINFANPDMVGHTGNLEATILAIEHVYICLGKIAAAVLKKKGTLIVTADHGNAEKKIDLETGEIWTSHTTNKVPFILADEEMKNAELIGNGALADIAPTIYALMNMEKTPRILNKGLLK